MTAYNLVHADSQVKVGKIKVSPEVARKLGVREGEYLKLSLGDGSVLFEAQIGDYGFARINRDVANALKLDRSIVKLEKLRFSRRKALSYIEVELKIDGFLNAHLMPYVKRFLVGKPVCKNTIIPIETPLGPVFAKIVKTKPSGMTGLISNETHIILKCRG